VIQGEFEQLELPLEYPRKNFWSKRDIEYLFLEVTEERHRQLSKWGIQRHPLGLAAIYSALADLQKRKNDELVEAGKLNWGAILLEEVYEALGAFTVEEAREELVQVAAVIFAILQDLDGAAGA